MSFKDGITSSTVKCLLLEEPSYLKTVEPLLKIAMPDLSVCVSKPFFLEAAPKDVDKGAAIQILAEKLNIHQSEIIAIGNAELRGFGEVIVASNNDHGVAEVVRRFILE